MKAPILKAPSDLTDKVIEKVINPLSYMHSRNIQSYTYHTTNIAVYQKFADELLNSGHAYRCFETQVSKLLCGYLFASMHCVHADQ